MRMCLAFGVVFVGVLLLGCGDDSVVAGVEVGDGAEDAGVEAPDVIEDGESDVQLDEDDSGLSPTPDTSQQTGSINCKEGDPCDDENPCTLNDLCVDGACTGEVLSCDDGIDCTVDSCGEDGTCRHAINPGSCLIEGVCHGGGEAHPVTPCFSCQPSTSYTSWSADDALSCDDGDACTTADRCLSGACVSGGVQTCDDGNPCTLAACNSDQGCVYTPTEANCEDGDACTLEIHASRGTAWRVSSLTAPMIIRMRILARNGCTNIPGDGACEDVNPYNRLPLR